MWTSLICVGAVYSIKLKKRVDILEKTLLMLEEMKMLLKYLNVPVNEMLKKLCEKDYLSELSFLYECSFELQQNRDFPVAWRDSLENSSHLYKSAEIDRLLQLGQNLGASDAENQIKLLDLQTVYFEEYLDIAKNKYKKQGNTALTLSALAGCMIFIVII